MGCPVCLPAGFLGGYLGSYLFGIQPPPTRKGKMISAILTAGMIGISIYALKTVFNISLCGGSNAGLLERSIRIGIQGFLFGVIYSIGINYLLGRFVYYQKDCSVTGKGPCCCNKK